MNLEFANRLANYRKKAGLSQEELAEKLGVTRQAVSKWECGESSPDTDNLIALAKLYNVTIDELIYGESKKEEKKEPFIHVKGEDGEVKINGVHVDIEDDEGNKVHIGDDGIKLKGHKEERKVVIEDKTLIEVIFSSLVPLAVTVAYLLCGFLIPNGEGWRNYWVLFFLIPILPSLFLAIRKRRFCVFAFPVLATAVYLALGMFINLWHPTWVIFLCIPIYYIVFGPIDNYFHQDKKHVIINGDVIDNEDKD